MPGQSSDRIVAVTTTSRPDNDALAETIAAYRDGMGAAIIRVLSTAHGDDVAQAVAAALDTNRRASFLLRVRLGVAVEDAIALADYASIVEHHWDLFASRFAGDRDVLRRLRLIEDSSYDVRARMTDIAGLLEQVGASGPASEVRARRSAVVEASFESQQRATRAQLDEIRADQAALRQQLGLPEATEATTRERLEASIAELDQTQRDTEARLEERTQATAGRLTALEEAGASSAEPRRTPLDRVDSMNPYDAPWLRSYTVLVVAIVVALYVGFCSLGDTRAIVSSSVLGEAPTPVEETSSSVAWRVSGRGDRVASATLDDGRYLVTTRVEGNRRTHGSTNFVVVIAAEGGTELVVSTIASSWEGTSLVSVGGPWSDNPTSRPVAVEVVAAGEWTVEFSPAPQTAPAAEAHALSGRGQDVRFVTLRDGSYTVTAQVVHNGSPRDPEPFRIDISGARGNARIASDWAAVWGGSSLITVGDSISDDLASGIAAVEVRAAGEWRVEFSPVPPGDRPAQPARGR